MRKYTLINAFVESAEDQGFLKALDAQGWRTETKGTGNLYFLHQAWGIETGPHKGSLEEAAADTVKVHNAAVRAWNASWRAAEAVYRPDGTAPKPDPASPAIETGPPTMPDGPVFNVKVSEILTVGIRAKRIPNGSVTPFTVRELEGDPNRFVVCIGETSFAELPAGTDLANAAMLVHDLNRAFVFGFEGGRRHGWYEGMAPKV